MTDATLLFQWNSKKQKDAIKKLSNKKTLEKRIFYFVCVFSVWIRFVSICIHMFSPFSPVILVSVAISLTRTVYLLLLHSFRSDVSFDRDKEKKQQLIFYKHIHTYVYYDWAIDINALLFGRKKNNTQTFTIRHAFMHSIHSIPIHSFHSLFSSLFFYSFRCLLAAWEGRW